MKINVPEILWSQLAKLNGVRFINTMYVWLFIVPVAARILQDVGESAQLTVFGHTFDANLTLPFSWIAFYFSALAFAAANVVFQIRCPGVIKEQGDYSQFKRANKGVEHIDGYLAEVGMNWEGLRKLVELQDDYFNEIAEVSNPAAEDGMLRKRFWAVYRRGNKGRSFAKLETSLLYFVGGVLLLFVLGQNVCFVVRYLHNAVGA